MIYLELFLTFFKIGLFTFGGGYAMLPLVQAEVATLGWLDEATLVNFVAISESTPGPFAINIATYVGSQMGSDFGVIGSIFGSFCATLGVVLPSFIIILIVAKIYDAFKKSSFVKGIMTGLKPAVVGLISAAALSIALTVLVPEGFSFEIFKNLQLYVSLFIFGVSAVMAFKKVHPILIICFSAVVGIVSGYLL